MDEKKEDNAAQVPFEKPEIAADAPKPYHPGFPAEADVTVNPTPATAISPEEVSGEGVAAKAEQGVQEAKAFVADAAEGIKAEAHDLKTEAEDWVEAGKQEAAETAEEIKEAADEAGETVRSAGEAASDWVDEAKEDVKRFADELKEDLERGYTKIKEEVADFARERGEHDPEKGWGKQARRDVDAWLDQAGKDLKDAGEDVKEWAQKTQKEFKEAVSDQPEDPNNPNFFREVGRTVKDIGENLKDFFEGDKPAGKG